jgi:PAS domain S-box-containing protein
MVLIPGYSITETLYESPRTLVLRSQPEGQPEETVILKVLRAEYPTLFELLCYRNHYTVAKCLNGPGVVKPLALLPYQHSYILVLEDFGGQSLQQFTQGHPLPLEEGLQLALQLTDILHDLHQQGVIHKQLEPAHILIHPETKQLKLTDFSIASLLPKETQPLKHPSRLEGTLAYLSPEQTGRMNRGLDYRSDFYSLGVTLYELLVGTLPFTAADLIALLHCHLAQQPPPPHEVNPAIPLGVSAVILKLMAKMPEDRYQSAVGLRHDLHRCLQTYQSTKLVPRFVLGTRDRCNHFQIPEKLYGRETEAATLLAAFDRITNPQKQPDSQASSAVATSELVLVSGLSGIGKTALVNEIHKPILRQRGHFIKGKFDQLRRNIPLSALIQAFQQMLRQLLTESSEALDQWKGRILKALGDNGQVLIAVIPELEQLIGPQLDAPALPPSAAQNRFIWLFSRFIQVFAQPDHPLVIFLDDLQWADAASLSLMHHVICEEPLASLLLIGAYRDNEVSPAHPLMVTLQTIQAQRPVTSLHLGPLPAAALNQLVAETLHCTQERAQPLAHWVMQKTQGNPFFATQFLRSLHTDGLITFNPQVGYWQCDLAQIQSRSVTPDVVEFMATQLRKLPEESQSVLKLAACIGNEFNLDTLALICGEAAHETATQLWPALQMGLLLPTSEIYRFFQTTQAEETVLTGQSPPWPLAEKPSPGSTDRSQPVSPTYRFLHDRVQQATYSLIPADQRPATHLQIGRLLWQHTTATRLEDLIFEILNALNRGASLIMDPKEALAVAQLNLTGGRKAKEATAYDVAASYLHTALQLLPLDGWQHHYRLTLALHNMAAEVAYLRGAFTAMETLIQAVLTQARTLLDKIKVYEVRIQAHTARNQPLVAVSVALEVLAQLGVKLPLKPTKLHLLIALLRARWALWGKSLPQLVSLPAVRDPRQLAIRQIMRSMSSSAYNAVPDLVPLLILRAVEQSIYRGHSPDSAYALAAYGVLLCGLFEDFDTGYQFGQVGLSLLERFNAQDQRPRTVMVVHNFLNHWKHPIQAGTQGLLAGYQVALETGDTEFAAFNIYLHCYQAYCAGYPLATLETDLKTYGQAVDQFNQVAIADLMRLYRQVVLNWLGHSPDPCQLQGDSYDEQMALPQAQQTNHRTTLFDIHFHKLVLNYGFGRYDQAVANGETARRYLDGAIATPSIPLFRFYDALACLAHAPQVSHGQRQRYRWRIHRHYTKLKRWARYGPMNLSHKVALLEAELHRQRGHLGQALDAYDRAITQAKAENFLQEQALSNERAALCLLAYQKPALAQVYLIQAYYDYARWGAHAKVQDLKNRYPELLAPVSQPHPPSSSDLGEHTSAALDLASVIKTSQALSQPLERAQLLERVMTVLMETGGAARGALVLVEGTQLQVVADVQSNQPAGQFTDHPLETSHHLPKTILHYTQHTLKTVVISNASVLDSKEAPDAETPTVETYEALPLTFQADSYLFQHQPKSLLCSPIHSQGQFIGLLYLENSLVSGAFTGDRITVLQLLTAQAAISLRNAQLYAQLEDYSRTLEVKVAERTRALEQEICDRNTIAHALRLSEEKFSKAFHATPNPVLISRLHDGLVLEVNDSFCAEAGYHREEVIGRTSQELNLWVLSTGRQQLLQLLQQQGGIRNQEFQFRRKDGEIRTALLSVEMIEIDGIQCLLAVANDITDRKHIEETLQQAKEAAEAASREKSKFLSRMSHELRTPLTTILGFTQLMGADPSVQTEHREQLNIIEHSSEHLLTLIHNILTMSKIEAGQISLDYQKFNLHHLLSNLQEMMQLRAHNKGLALNFHYDDTVPQWIQTDQVKLRQILINLLSNAIKFTDRGEVTLRVWTEEPLAPAPALLYILHFAVTDTGPGLSETEIPQLFQPFYQTELGHYTQEGSGLGLSISQSFVRLMGGDITVHSHPGKTTQFQFHIPVEVVSEISTVPAPPGNHQVMGLAPNQPSYRILIVEDDRMSQAVMKRLLTSVGFQVKQASDGTEAIQIWQQWHPHLIWMDMRMPGMNGHEATQRIRTLEANRPQPENSSSLAPQPSRTKIIALTANAFDEDRLTMLSVGCDDFISKPFLRTVILDKLAEHLGVEYHYQTVASP